MTANNSSKVYELQKILKDTPYNINLPTLVFLGSQSSGKSSVLERLIHCDILPKGCDITTKCPIEINLQRTDEEEFAIIHGKRYAVDKAKAIIQREMDKISSESYISKDLLRIEIYSKNCANISLVDLPGLTKVALKGQPIDIEKQTLDITMKYLKNENTILLPVIPANADISTAEVLKICKMVDKEGKRTLGIVTKIDLMDNGTSCIDILQNKIAPLEMGYVGVINRGQSELTKGQGIQSILEKENRYFLNDEEYVKLWPNVGIQFLENKLQDCFDILLSQTLPKIHYDITEKLKVIDEKIAQSRENRSLESILIAYAKTLKNVLKGKHIKQDNLFTYVSEGNFMQEFKEALRVQNSKITFDKKIIEEIQNSNSLFISDNLFEKIVNSYFDSYRIETIAAFDAVASVIANHIKKIKSEKHQNLANQIGVKVKSSLLTEIKNLKEYYNGFTKIHTCCVNTSHPDFSKQKILHNVLSKCIKARKENNDKKYFGMFATSNSVIDINERFDVDLIYEFTHTYFECNKKFMADHAIKSAYFYLVDNFGKICYDYLLANREDFRLIYEKETQDSVKLKELLEAEKSTYIKLLEAINIISLFMG